MQRDFGKLEDKKRDEHVGNFTDRQKVTDEDLVYAFFCRSEGSIKEYFERVLHRPIDDVESKEFLESAWSGLRNATRRDLFESEEGWPF